MTRTDHSMPEPSPADGGGSFPADTFEHRLLQQLQADVASRRPTSEPASDPAGAVTRGAATAPAGHRARRRVALGGVLAAATAVGVVALTSTSSPAYAIESHDGTVTVTITSLSDAAGLQKALRDNGVPAVVDYAPQGRMCSQPRGTRATPRGPVSGSMSSRSGEAVTFSINTGTLAADESVVIESMGGPWASGIGIQFVTGPVAPCRLVDAPALPAPRPGDPGPVLDGGPGQGVVTHVDGDAPAPAAPSSATP